MVPFEDDVQGFLRQILEALDFIHERNIAHLDIKVILEIDTYKIKILKSPKNHNIRHTKIQFCLM